MTAIAVLARRTPAENLEALGIDRPYWRWTEARKYLRGLHAGALREVRSLAREWLLYRRVKWNWSRRGKPESGPDRTDMADALEWFKRTFIELADSMPI